MSSIRQLRERLGYANVVSTLALFVALGGASYAAVTLPANSVGARQLRAGAVAPQTLAFPLGVRVFTAAFFVLPELPRCRDFSPGRPTSSPACYVKPSPTVALGHIHLHAPAQLLLSAIASLEDGQQSGSSTELRLELFFDGHSSGRTFVTLHGGDSTSVPIQALVEAKAGVHAIAVGAWADHRERSGSVSGYRFSVAVTALPQGASPGAVYCTESDRLLC